MRIHPRTFVRPLARGATALLCSALAVAAARSASADDTDLFSTSVPPNVMLLVDNSGSMNEIIWHPAFNPALVPTCAYFDNNVTYAWTGNVSGTVCGNTRTLYDDTGNALANRASGRYLNWYWSDASDAYFKGTSNNDSDNIESLANGTRSQCLQSKGYGATYSRYRRGRITAAQEVLREVICQVNAAGKVRFGLAKFYDSSDPEGGWVAVPINDYTTAHATAIDTFISQLSANSWTPLAESLYKVYRYFQSRTSPADGVSGTFPAYNIKTDGTTTTTTSLVPPTPLQAECQKSFVIVITDGEPTMDDFNTMTQFTTLVGDFNTDNTTPEAGVEVPGDGSKTGYYLDDLAKFMHERDFQKDFTGDQTIDTYTVGFSTALVANQLLQKTANAGNGLFHTSNNAEQLSAAIIEQITDIIQKSQSFTSATVPASRTTEGDNFYASYFRPRANSPFWEGHLKNFKFTGAGDILTGNDKCVIGDGTQSPPCPTSGPLSTASNGVTEWGSNGDAADRVPAPVSRNLLVGRSNTSFGAKAAPWFSVNGGGVVSSAITRFDVGLDVAPDSELAKAPYSLASPTTTAQRNTLTDDVVSHLAGCDFGTRLGGTCVTRTSDGVVSLLGDIFHSNPLVVGSPNAPINDSTYNAFARLYQTRDRVIYAGANDGFLRGFHAGDWQTVDASSQPLTPPRHDRGTGTELFGYMPTDVRENIWKLPISQPSGTIRRLTTVDGSPVAADVWMYRNVNTGTGALTTVKSPPVSTGKVVEQWRTVLMGGLRDGGRSYYALDVTNPGATAYPGYLWDFPCDDCATAVNPNTSGAKNYMGTTWSEPVITRVRVAVNGQPGKHDRWVAVFGAGYDVCGDPNSLGYFKTAASETCDASDATKRFRGRGIFMVDLTTGELLAQKVFAAADTFSNGGQVGYDELKFAFASAPAVFDIDLNGYADVIYIGDLGGRLWKWDVEATGDDPINNGATDNSLGQPDWPFELFFRASHSDDVVSTPGEETYTDASHFQSFFFPPAGVVKKSRLTLVFGAGERADPTVRVNDGLASNNNHFYVVKDLDPRVTQTPVTYTEAYLDDVANIESGGTSADCSIGTVGYFLTGDDGEKFITDSVVFLGTVITGSFVPADPSASLCNRNGTAYIYRFRMDCAVGKYPNTVPKEKRRRAGGTGLPTRPRVSVGSFENPDEPCANRAIMIMSDGTADNECEDTPGKPVELQSWRERQ